MLQKESSFIDVDDVCYWNTSHAKRGGVCPIILTQGHVPWQECKNSRRRSGLPLQSKMFLRPMYLRTRERVAIGINIEQIHPALGNSGLGKNASIESQLFKGQALHLPLRMMVASTTQWADVTGLIENLYPTDAC